MKEIIQILTDLILRNQKNILLLLVKKINYFGKIHREINSHDFLSMFNKNQERLKLLSEISLNRYDKQKCLTLINQIKNL